MHAGKRTTAHPNPIKTKWSWQPNGKKSWIARDRQALHRDGRWRHWPMIDQLPNGQWPTPKEPKPGGLRITNYNSRIAVV